MHDGSLKLCELRPVKERCTLASYYNCMLKEHTWFLGVPDRSCSSRFLPSGLLSASRFDEFGRFTGSAAELTEIKYEIVSAEVDAEGDQSLCLSCGSRLKANGDFEL